MWCFLIAMVALPRAASAEELAGLEDALAEIDARFPVSVDSDSLYRAALEGVARHLGEVMSTEGNRVLTVDEQSAHARWLEGHRNGIGAEFSIIAGRGLMITEVFKGGPAATTGVRSGDLVVSIDDHPFTGMGPAAIHSRVRRSKTPASILDIRREDGSIRRLTVTHGPYRVPTVRGVADDASTPVARIPFFGRGTAEALRVWLRGQRSSDAVVIDLRDNGGGALDEVVASADLFLEPGSIVVNRGRDRDAMEPITATREAVWLGNVVVLVNQGTEGVAEAFSAALRDNGRGLLVGTRTGGRSVDVSVYEAGRGFVIEVADTHLSAPSGTSWSQRGLAPNVIVESSNIAIPVGGGGSMPDLQRDTALRLISTTSIH